MDPYLCCGKKLVDIIIKIPYEVYLEYHQYKRYLSFPPSSEIENFRSGRLLRPQTNTERANRAVSCMFTFIVSIKRQNSANRERPLWGADRHVEVGPSRACGEPICASNRIIKPQIRNVVDVSHVDAMTRHLSTSS